MESYSYDVFGAPNRVSDVNNPYMFTGRRFDPETALYYYRARYYASDIGRFLQTDPVGYAGGLNLYTYCGNNPINWVDPWGLCREQPTKLTPEKFYAEMAKLRETIRGREWWQRWNPYSYISNDSVFWFGADNDRLYGFEGRLMRGNGLNYYGIGMLYRRYWGFLGPVGRWGAIRDTYLWKSISYEFTDLQLGKRYWYSVKARNSAGTETGWSNVESSLQVTLADAVEAMLDPDTLKNKNMKNALINKINAVQQMLDAGRYEEALNKLQNDILAKMNGCAETGEPDKNDWIITCEEQSQLYPLVIETIENVKGLMQ